MVGHIELLFGDAGFVVYWHWREDGHPSAMKMGGKPWGRDRQPSAADSWQGAGRMSLRWGVGGPPHKCKTICPVSRLVLAIFSGNDSAAACTRISAKHLIPCRSVV